LKAAALAGGIIVLAVLPFASSLAGGFVWDDHAQIELNRHLGLPSLAGYWFESEHAFAEVGRSSRYNPVGWSVFVLENLVSGGARPPWLFHATSLFVHGLCALVLFLLLRGTLGEVSSERSQYAPLGLALCFAWWPVQAEVASWPSARFESLASLFVLGGALLLLRSTSPGRAFFAGLVATFALFAKESALGPALVLPAILLLPQGTSWPGVRRRILGACAGLALGIVLFFGLRASAGVGLPEAVGTLAPQRVLLAELRLLRLAVWPPELSLMRGVPLDASLGDLLAGGGLLLALVLGLSYRRTLAGRLALAGGLVLLLGTLPGAVAAAQFDLLPDRYVYIGFLGVPFLLAAFFEGLALRARARGRKNPQAFGRFAFLFLGCVLAASLWADRTQALRWSDDRALFSAEVELWPSAPQTHYHLGLAHRMVGDHPSAEESLKTAIRHGPGLWQSWSELAVTALDLGDYAQARWALDEGILATGGHPRLVELGGMLDEEAARRGLVPTQAPQGVVPALGTESSRPPSSGEPGIGAVP